MVAARAILKFMYSKLFHVICLTHLLRNCAMKINSHFEDVDQLIAKFATVEDKVRQAKFATIGCPPQSVVTRWGKWLIAALYYAKNLFQVKAMLESFEKWHFGNSSKS